MNIEKIVVGSLETNCYILRSDHMGIIIDPGDEPDKIIEAVGESQIIMILATHRHFDHVAALKEVKEAVKAKAAIHLLDWCAGFDIKLEDGQEIEFDDQIIKVIHTPGHTPGGCCFHLGNDLFSGDTLFPGGPGNTAFPGGSEKVILKSIREKLMRLSDETLVYPGHGPATTIAKERVLY